MQNIRVYLIIFVLFLSSLATSSMIINLAQATNNNPPPIDGGVTKQTWFIDGQNVPRKDAGPIWTVDIEITSTGRMEWTKETAYIGGNFYCNGTFVAYNSSIFFQGTDFDIRGTVELYNCNLTMNNTVAGDSNIFVRSGAFLNITDSRVRSNQTSEYYDWTYESGSSGSLVNSHIYHCGSSDKGLFVQSSAVEFEGCTFKDNQNHIDTLNANPKIKNCTFHGGVHLGQYAINATGTSTAVHVVSSIFNVSECRTEGTSVLYRDFFVIVNTINNTKLQGVGGSTIEFKDSNGQTVVAVSTSGTPGLDLGVAQAVRCTGEYYDDLPADPVGVASINPYEIIATDPWNEIQPVPNTFLNASITIKDAKQLIHHTFSFDFAPKITFIDPAISVEEKKTKGMNIDFHDYDYGGVGSNPAELTIAFNSTWVVYNPQSKQLDFTYPNGAPVTSVVNVSINDTNGNYVYADIDVTFTAVNDPPAIDIPVADFHVWEDHVKYIDISVTDVDNLMNEITIGSNSTQSIKYLGNGSLEILYTNSFGRDLKQDRVKIWATDGIANESTDILITFHQTPDAPVITKGISVADMPEDLTDVGATFISFDLNTYWRDDDFDAYPVPANKPIWIVTGNDTASVRVSETTFIMEITPFENAFGIDLVTIYLEDGDGLSDSTTFYVNITPINDEPFTRNAAFTPAASEAGDTFTFKVEYVDIENQAPTKINLKIDSDEYAMSASDSDNDHRDGKKYQVDVQLFTEAHDYMYVINDGHGDVEIGPVYTTSWPKIIEVWRFEEKWSVGKELYVRMGYYSTAGGDITINENPTKPSNSTFPLEYSDIGFFYGISTTIQNVQFIEMKFDLDKANITDIFVTITEVMIYWYDSADLSWNETLDSKNSLVGGVRLSASNFTMDLSSEVLFAPMGPVDNDVDGDGVFNDEDEFPFDPDEWEDSDKDEVGDNTDKFPYDISISIDADGDGYPDVWNPGYSASAVDPDLYLDEFINDSTCSRDFDDDGTCDEKDDDDDGDGMPDIYEKNYDFLNPFDDSDRNTDYDGDGASNYREYDHGTEPDNAKSVPPKIEDNGSPIDSNLTIIAIIIIIILIVVVLLVFFRKPKEDKALVTPPEGEVMAPPEPAPEYAYEQPPVEGVEGEGAHVEPDAEMEAPAEGEFEVDDSAAESMVPEEGQVMTEGGEQPAETEAEDTEAEDTEAEDTEAEDIEEEDDTVSEEEFDDIEEET